MHLEGTVPRMTRTEDRRPPASRIASMEARLVRRRHERGGFDPDRGRPDERLPAGADRLPEIEHIVVLMMENHSYDNYLGAMTGRGDGLPVDGEGRFATSNPAGDGRAVAPHRLRATEQPPQLPCQSWEASHAQWDGGAMDGF